MEAKKVGGAIIAAVGVLAPWIADRLAITIPPFIGYPLLGLCALLFMFGVGMLLWPKKEAGKVTDKPEWPEKPAAFTGLGNNNTFRNVGVLAHDRAGIHLAGEGNIIEDVEVVTTTSSGQGRSREPKA